MNDGPQDSTKTPEPIANTGDAKYLDQINRGLDEEQVEKEDGEIPGDRLGDTPVAGVVQDHDGAGHLLATKPEPAIVAVPADPLAAVLQQANITVASPIVEAQHVLPQSHTSWIERAASRVKELIGEGETEAHALLTHIMALVHHTGA